MSCAYQNVKVLFDTEVFAKVMERRSWRPVRRTHVAFGGRSSGAKSGIGSGRLRAYGPPDCARYPPCRSTLKETHVDADPNMVMSLVGSDGDLLDFIPGIITRTNTPGVYQDLVTRNGGGSHGCPVCSYDPLGNVLSTTDARGFTTIFDRSEMGEVYRTTSPAPYNYRVEKYYDANRNVVRMDTEDQQVAYESGDPTDAL